MFNEKQIAGINSTEIKTVEGIPNPGDICYNEMNSARFRLASSRNVSSTDSSIPSKTFMKSEEVRVIITAF